MALGAGLAVWCLTAGAAHAQNQSKMFQLELGAAFGGHFFANDLELGVADDPALPSPKTSILAGLRLGVALHPMVSVEGEIVGIPTSDSINNYSAWVAGYRIHALVNITQAQALQGKLTPFVLAGVGSLSVISTEGIEYGEIKKDTDTVFHAGVGARYRVTPLIAVRLDGRVLGVPNTKSKGLSPDFELMAGVSVFLGGKSGPAAPPPPPMVKDSDRDDIPDPSDKCPLVAEDKDGFQDDDGCPEPDNDADGIADADDKCPKEAETKNGIDDEDGCPEEDKDADGIVGSKDKCPDQPEDKDNFQDDDGCPEPDNDLDGIADASDKCPTDPETKNGYLDEDGCADQVPAAVAKFTGVITGINFKQNSADVAKSSFPTLKKAVQVLKDYPALRIEISGHTSNEGKRDVNMKLSKDRAESVKAYLVSAGVEEGRISTVGYGPDKPIADNATKKGKSENRRIEFRLVSQGEASGGAAGAPAAAPAEKPAAAPAEKPAAPSPPKSETLPEVIRKRAVDASASKAAPADKAAPAADKAKH